MRIIRAEPLRHYQLRKERLGWLDRLFLGREHEKPNFNRRMFDEDFARLFSYGTDKSGNLFSIASSNDKLTDKLLANIDTQHAPHRIDETIRSWVEEIAQSLVRFGTAYYYLHNDTELDDIHMNSFGPDGVARFFGTSIQWVPERTERHWDKDDEEIPREVRILNSDKVLRFTTPKAIKRILVAQNKTLAILDKHQLGATNFLAQATYENPTPTNHFDFSVWRDLQERVLYRSTRASGWNGRKYDPSKRSDFFDCQRLIRFRRNQLVLRDEIIRQLSVELSRVGKSYDAEYSVEIFGTDELPSVAYLNALDAKLTREEVGFTEVIDYCFKR